MPPAFTIFTLGARIGRALRHAGQLPARAWNGLKERTGLPTEALICALPVAAAALRLAEYGMRDLHGAQR